MCIKLTRSDDQNLNLELKVVDTLLWIIDNLKKNGSIIVCRAGKNVLVFKKCHCLKLRLSTNVCLLEELIFLVQNLKTIVNK